MSTKLQSIRDVADVLQWAELPWHLRDVMGYADVTGVDFLGLTPQGGGSPLPIGVLHDQRRSEPYRQQQQQQQQMQQMPEGYFIEKPFNAVLNWRKLLSNVPEQALMVGGAVSASWMMIIAALVLSQKLLDLQSIKLSEEQATVMLVLSAKYGFRRAVREEDLFKAVDQHLTASGMKQMSEATYNKTIDDLVRLRSIDLSDGKVRLVEEVPVQLTKVVFIAGKRPI